MDGIIGMFEGEYAFLSNFSSHPVLIANKIWPTTEHYYQAMKTHDPHQVELIRCASTPGEAKSLGRKCTIRDDWEHVKLVVMYEALNAKFQPGSQLGKMLLDTGDDMLIEGNYWHDQYWGNCMCKTHKDIPGQNQLGKQLMVIRKVLRDWQMLKR